MVDLKKKGFTLIELLVVVAIVAVLATAVVLVLNPVQLIKQSRDSKRMSDLTALSSMMNLWIGDVSNQTSGWANVAAGCTTDAYQCCSYAMVTAECEPVACSLMGGYSSVNSSALDGTGWVPIDFTVMTFTPPLSRLPVDPQTGNYDYVLYASTTPGKYKFFGCMESTKFSSGGSADKETTDGGNDSNLYEVGSDMSL